MARKGRREWEGNEEVLEVWGRRGSVRGEGGHGRAGQEEVGIRERRREKKNLSEEKR